MLSLRAARRKNVPTAGRGAVKLASIGEETFSTRQLTFPGDSSYQGVTDPLSKSLSSRKRFNLGSTAIDIENSVSKVLQKEFLLRF